MARYFDGSGNQKVFFPGPSRLFSPLRITISAWVYLPSGGGSANWNYAGGSYYARILSNGDYSVDGTGWSLAGGGSASYLAWWLWGPNPGDYYQIGGEWLSAMDGWSHQYLTGVSGGNWEVFQNNISKGTASSRTGYPSQQGLWTGVYAKTPFTGNSFKGRVANVAIWNEVLSPGERSLLASGVDPVAVRPQARTSLIYFDESLKNYALGGLPGQQQGMPLLVSGPEKLRRRRVRRDAVVKAAAGGGGTVVPAFDGEMLVGGLLEMSGGL